MLTAQGPKVIEFKSASAIPRPKSSFRLIGQRSWVPRLISAAEVELSADSFDCILANTSEWCWPLRRDTPGAIRFERRCAITGLDEVAWLDGVMVFHAGTTKDAIVLVTAGSRSIDGRGRGTTYEDTIDRRHMQVSQASPSR